MNRKRHGIVASILAALFFLAVLAACGGQDFAYQDSKEMKPGSGLFSGRDGVFTLYEGNLEDLMNKKDSAK